MADKAPAITKTNVTALAPEESGMFSDTRLQMIRNMVAKDAPEDVFVAMIDIAKTRKLDPLAKQIICVPFSGKWTYIVTIDGYRSIAEQTGVYAGNDAPVFTWYDPAVFTSANKMIPQSATVTVYKLVQGERMPFSATVFWEEYNGGRNNWLTMPATMLAKVAETHALRKAFPAVLGGMPTDEDPGEGYIEVDGRQVNTGTGEIQPERPPQRPRPSPQPRSQTQQSAAPRQDPKITAANKRKALVSSIYGFGKNIGLESDVMDLLVVELAPGEGPTIEDIPFDKLEAAFKTMRDHHRKDPGGFVDYVQSLAEDVIDVEPVEIDQPELVPASDPDRFTN